MTTEMKELIELMENSGNIQHREAAAIIIKLCECLSTVCMNYAELMRMDGMDPLKSESLNEAKSILGK